MPSDRPGDGFFSCNAVLPNKAVVTKVAFTLLDQSGAFVLQYCALSRISLQAANEGTYDNLAVLPVTTHQGAVRLATSVISNPTVDNANYAYELQCQFTGPTSALGLYGASVWYQISAVNG